MSITLRTKPSHDHDEHAESQESNQRIVQQICNDLLREHVFQIGLLSLIGSTRPIRESPTIIAIGISRLMPIKTGVYP